MPYVSRPAPLLPTPTPSTHLGLNLLDALDDAHGCGASAIVELQVELQVEQRAVGLGQAESAALSVGALFNVTVLNVARGSSPSPSPASCFPFFSHVCSRARLLFFAHVGSFSLTSALSLSRLVSFSSTGSPSSSHTPSLSSLSLSSLSLSLSASLFSLSPSLSLSLSLVSLPLCLSLSLRLFCLPFVCRLSAVFISAFCRDSTPLRSSRECSSPSSCTCLPRPAPCPPPRPRARAPCIPFAAESHAQSNAVARAANGRGLTALRRVQARARPPAGVDVDKARAVLCVDTQPGRQDVQAEAVLPAGVVAGQAARVRREDARQRRLAAVGEAARGGEPLRMARREQCVCFPAGGCARRRGPERVLLNHAGAVCGALRTQRSISSTKSTCSTGVSPSFATMSRARS